MNREITCTRCGTVNEYFTNESGPHTQAICNHCKKYIANIPKGIAINKPSFQKNSEYVRLFDSLLLTVLPSVTRNFAELGHDMSKNIAKGACSIVEAVLEERQKRLENKEVTHES